MTTTAALQSNDLKYHIWTMGCQMNKADSDYLSSGLEELGLKKATSEKGADVVVVNTCVVRQQAEDTAISMINKLANFNGFIAVMGCLVGAKQDDLKLKFPHVDVWTKPQNYAPIIERVALEMGADAGGCLSGLVPKVQSVSAYIPVVHGCDKFCSFCIIPYRRGREISRPIEELVNEITLMAQKGVKDITLLGQNVDSYGHDLRPRRDLADLLAAVNDVELIDRVRFLTSHPNDMSKRILGAVRDLPKVCKNINLPFQAGNNRVLADMRRGYTKEQYLEKVLEVRETIPGVVLTTDVIVGFSNETEEEFCDTLDVLERVKFNKVHSYTFSLRPHSYAIRKMEDNVPHKTKKSRLHRLNELQKEIQTQINSTLLKKKFEVLFDAYKDGQTSGRTKSDKLVFVADEGKNIKLGTKSFVEVVKTTPWSLRAVLAS